jgi:hypothetical protein
VVQCKELPLRQNKIEVIREPASIEAATTSLTIQQRGAIFYGGATASFDGRFKHHVDIRTHAARLSPWPFEEAAWPIPLAKTHCMA